MAFLDETGLRYLWGKLKQRFLPLSGGTLTGGLTAGSLTSTGRTSTQTLSVGGSDVADFIVAKGESGSWEYWKRNSGVAECWGKFLVYQVNPNVLQSTVSLPFSFTAVTSALGTLNNPNSNQATALSWNVKVKINDTSSLTLVLHSIDDSFVSGAMTYISVHVFGRWK